MGKYLVTGAAGFIGSCIAKKLLGLGHSVVTLDNLSTGYRENIPTGCVFIEGHCQDSATISQLASHRFDAILHVAGQSSGEVSFENPVYDLQTNTQSTLMLLKYAVETGCRRFLYTSSMSVYGDQEDKPVSENAPCVPKSFYGVGKLASEHYLRIFSAYGIDGTSLRLFNVYGPGQNMKNLKQGMVSIYLAQALKNRKIVVKGSLERYRDFIYIDDVVDAYVTMLECRASYGKIYNIGTSQKIHVKQVLEQICQEIPGNVDIEVVTGTPGDQFGIRAEIKKAKEDVGWEPRISFPQGLTLMTNFYKDKISTF